MSLLKSSMLTPIGIDLDYNEFRAIQFIQHDRPILKSIATIPRVGSRSLTPSDEECQELAQTLCQRGFSGNRVVLGVPKETSSFHILELPPEGSGAPVAKLALLEAQRSGSHPTKDLQVGYWRQPPKDPPSKHPSPYYTVASQTNALDELIDPFESANLLPIRIEPIETALCRAAVCHQEFVEDSIHCITEIGWDQSWAVITLGSTPVYSRKIDYGVSRIRRQLIDDHMMPVSAINALLNPSQSVLDPNKKVDRILSALITPLMNQIVDQIDIALTYVSQQHRFAPFGVVFRSGYYSNLDQCAYAVAQRTGMPTLQLEGVRDDGVMQVTPFEIQQSPRLNIATGLALGGAA